MTSEERIALYSSRSTAYRNEGEYDEAIADCSEAIRLNPKLAGAYYARAFTYGQKGESDKAIADYTEVIRLEPKLTDA